MRLLVWLSLAYAAVLVAALAVSLTLILVYLWRVRAALQPVAAALVSVEQRTGPLRHVMTGVTETIATVQGEIGGAADAMERAAGVIGIEPPSPPVIRAHASARWQESG